MSKSIEQQLAEAKAALAATQAELQAAKSAPRRRVSQVEVPSLTQHNEAGELVQTQTGCQIVAQGGPWTTAVQSAKVEKDGSTVVYLRKYQTRILKDTDKLRDGEVVGQKVLRQRSSFRINSADQWKAINAFAEAAFAPASEEATA